MAGREMRTRILPMNFLKYLFAVSALGLLAFPTRGLCQEPADRAALVQRAKSAVVQVKRGTRYLGAAFCIHPSGIFLTCDVLVRTEPGQNLETQIVLNPTLKNQSMHKVVVLRTDLERGLAVLKAEGPGPWTALPLGDSSTVTELAELVTIGFPSEVLGPSPQPTPPVVNMLNVTSLRLDEKRELHRLQLDSNLLPGSTGGPLLDESGRVVGLVTGGILGAGISLAIPVNHAQKLVGQPMIHFSPPEFSRAALASPVEFKVEVVSLLARPEDLQVEMLLKGPGQPDRTVRLTGNGSTFSAKVAPFPKTANARPVTVQIAFADGELRGQTDDRPLNVGTSNLLLSEVAKLTSVPSGEITKMGGEKLTGKIGGLEKFDLRIGGQTYRVNVEQAQQLNVIATDSLSLDCLIVVKDKQREIGRLAHQFGQTGSRHAALEAIKKGTFSRPQEASSLTHYCKIFVPTDLNGQGTLLEYADQNIECLAASLWSVDLMLSGRNSLELSIASPRGQRMSPTTYPVARSSNMSSLVPRVRVSGPALPSMGEVVTGKFVVWEFLYVNNRLSHAAIDFELRGADGNLVACGQARFHSHFE